MPRHKPEHNTTSVTNGSWHCAQTVSYLSVLDSSHRIRNIIKNHNISRYLITPQIVSLVYLGYCRFTPINHAIVVAHWLGHHGVQIPDCNTNQRWTDIRRHASAQVWVARKRRERRVRSWWGQSRLPWAGWVRCWLNSDNGDGFYHPHFSRKPQYTTGGGYGSGPKFTSHT